MSDDVTNASDSTTDEAMPIDELAMLKQRATLMGIKFSNNISVETLRKKIEDKMAGEAATEETESLGDPAFVAPVAATTATVAPVRQKTLREHLHEEHMKLVRLRITNLDPKKKDLPGEILTVANEVLGTVRKFVPFGAATDNGYHVPHCLYEMLAERKFLSITVRKVNGKEQVEQRWVPEFALEVLPPLTPAEIAKLAAAQAAASGME